MLVQKIQGGMFVKTLKTKIFWQFKQAGIPDSQIMSMARFNKVGCILLLPRDMG